MNQQPDKFFRDKLDGYQRPAPPSAWDKIISAERKKKHRAIWLSVAASILPLLLAGYMLWPIERTENTPLATKHNDDKPATKESAPEAGVDTAKARQTPSVEKHNAPQLAGRTKASHKSGANHQKNITTDNNDKARANEVVTDLETLPQSYKEEVAQSSTVQEDLSLRSATEVVVIDTNKKERATMTLVYTASDVSQYLDKNNEDDATSSSKKPSTLKKLLMKANDLSAQDPLGELRQKKNEILALNFKGKGNVDKTSKQ